MVEILLGNFPGNFEQVVDRDSPHGGRCENPSVGECKAEFTYIFVANKLLFCHRSLSIPMS